MCRVRQILAEVKTSTAEYYRLTGKPLGVTGEIAEFVAAELLSLELAPARTVGYDAIQQTAHGPERIQIKSRVYGADAKPSQRIRTLKRGAACDAVLLVLLDNHTLDPCEIREAPCADIIGLLDRPGSKVRDRGALSVSSFKKVAKRIWPASAKKQMLIK